MATHQSKPPKGWLFIEDHVDEDGQTVPGIASRLGITVTTYRKWRMRDWGPETLKHGKRVIARETAVEDYLTAKERAGRKSSPEMRPAEPRVPRQSRPAA